eukprot:6456649-Amphidinium_carterae.1
MRVHVSHEWWQVIIELGWLCTKHDVILVEAHGGRLCMCTGVVAENARKGNGKDSAACRVTLRYARMRAQWRLHGVAWTRHSERSSEVVG